MRLVTLGDPDYDATVMARLTEPQMPADTLAGIGQGDSSDDEPSL